MSIAFVFQDTVLSYLSEPSALYYCSVSGKKDPLNNSDRLVNYWLLPTTSDKHNSQKDALFHKNYPLEAERQGNPIGGFTYKPNPHPLPRYLISVDKKLILDTKYDMLFEYDPKKGKRSFTTVTPKENHPDNAWEIRRDAYGYYTETVLKPKNTAPKTLAEMI